MTDSTNPNDPPSDEDVLLAQFQRGPKDAPASESLRFAIREFSGRQFIDARLYFQDQGGSWRPTRKGITVRAHEAAEVIAALQRGLDLLTGGHR